ncbi:alginate lyase [Streptomyces sp. 846.5]|nr:polysaccharide lyase family 7 protein [Streptomyces sp. 846.5]TDU01736.1 alginate lyase [Streptomyces sp. 846.5]
MNRMKWIAGTVGAVVLAAGVTSAASASTSGSSAKSSVGSSATVAVGSAAAAAPSSISLASWAGLLLPVDSVGHLSGKDARVLKPARLISPWLTRTTSGALTFWAPSGGATTPGSLHSRTELESAVKYAVGTQKHVLTATLQVLRLPESNPEICVAQLHAGGSGGSSPFVMVDFKSGKLYVMVKSGTSAASHFYTLLTGVPLGSSFSYRVADNGNGTLTISAAHGSASQSYTVAVPGVLRGASGHFSAGDYEQGTVSGGANDGGKVLFTALVQS